MYIFDNYMQLSLIILFIHSLVDGNDIYDNHLSDVYIIACTISNN